MPCESVGGDFVDVITMPDGRWVLAIADVTGHGLPAALATLSVHSIVHTCLRSDMALDQMMQTLNEYMCDYLPGDRFVTMICIAIDPKTGELSCVNAGHHAPAILKSDGEVRLLQEASHLPLGLDRFEFETQHATLAPNELLVMSTDGLTELPQSDGELMGNQGVCELIAEVSGPVDQPLEELAESINAKLKSLYSDQPAKDDQTFLLARRLR